MKKNITLSIGVLLVLLICTPAIAVPLEKNPKTAGLRSVKFYLFGRIDGWYWQNDSLFHWRIINGSNYRVIGSSTFTYSHEFEYDVIRRGWGYAFGNYNFKGLLNQHFICGMIYSGESRSENHVTCSTDKSLGYFFYHSFEYFKGEIDNLTIEGNTATFLGKNLTVHNFWNYHRSWGIRITYAKNDEFLWMRSIDGFKGTLEPNYIKGFFHI